MAPRRLQTYEGQGLTVTWDPTRCVHSAVCARHLPRVFDPSRKRWIRPEQAPAEEVMAVIRRCPSGALQFRLEGPEPPASSAAPHPSASLEVMPDGPLVVDGPMRITLDDGTVIEREGTVAFCRCGGTATPPFCDGSHTRPRSATA